MAPVYRALAMTGIEPVLISTGQHLELLRTALRPLELVPDHELEIMTPDQTPASVAARVLDRLPPLLDAIRPDAVLVQGDTTSAFATAFVAYHQRIPVGHVEAGLRTFDDRNPFPEEINRQMIARLTRWSFAPTALSRTHLLAEHIAEERIFVTGNTAVDALVWMVSRAPRPPVRGPYLLVTLHRRESFGEPLRDVLAAISDFLDRERDASVVWPVHPNPRVKAVAEQVFGDHPGVELVAPLDYDVFAPMLAGARLVLSDSGGVQEEAPSFGKIVLVAREVTERPEALVGLNRLVGRDRATIRDALVAAWHEPPYVGPIPAPNPYGDGHAGERIASILARELGHAG